ncbi:MAG: AAA family ATPase [Gemmatimonadetes bacterium]|nr:AAA family ATPase [Gemmatimonadota bacterium]
MARSDLLVNLVMSSVSGDKIAFRKTVEAIIAEERAKQHHIVADRLERALYKNNRDEIHQISSSKPDLTIRAQDFVIEVVPRRRLEDLVLPETTLTPVRQLVEEQQRASILRSHSLEPKHSVLLVGPPGNGKTSLAEAIAESLAVPFFVVRYELMFGSFLGETAGRLKRVFEYSRTTPCVLFFDEFDAIGKERGDTHETGEIKRVVTSLLMQIDELPSYVVVVAATNHAELLDRAVWRRFELSLTLPAPTLRQLASFLTDLCNHTGVTIGVPTQEVAERIGSVSFSEAEQFFLDLARCQVLSFGEKSSSAITNEQLKIWATRVRRSTVESEKG